MSPSFASSVHPDAVFTPRSLTLTFESASNRIPGQGRPQRPPCDLSNSIISLNGWTLPSVRSIPNFVMYSGVTTAPTSGCLAFEFGLAPARSRISTAVCRPIIAATISGVVPSLFLAFTLAPALSRILMAAVRPSLAASWRGVNPLLSFAFALAPVLNKVSIAVVWPHAAATWSRGLSTVVARQVRIRTAIEQDLSNCGMSRECRTVEW